MSRPLRLQYPGAVYHITSRGNGRQKIFKDQTDFFTFIDLLGKEILRRENKDAYRAMVYLLRRLINMGIVEVSRMFKISESMVSRIQRETERGTKTN